jgi:hypothetical protein
VVNLFNILDKYITNKEKKRKMGDEHLRKLRGVPCKYIVDGIDNCPFGTGCFYLHKDKLFNDIKTFKPIHRENEFFKPVLRERFLNN